MYPRIIKRGAMLFIFKKHVLAYRFTYTHFLPKTGPIVSNLIIAQYKCVLRFVSRISLVMANKPKIVVFDLDYTLWPFWVDTHVTPPFQKGPNGDILDAHKCKVKYYKEVPEVLKKLKEDGYKIAIASRTNEIEGANQLLELFNWSQYFTYKQIFPGCKVTHFQNIKKESGVDFKDMIFFDDEHRNIKDINKIGAVSILVKDGVSNKVVADGITFYNNQRL